MTPGLILAGIFLILVIVTIAMGVRIVPQGYKFVVQRLGKYHKTLNPGLNVIIPYMDTVAYKVPTKDLVLDVKRHPDLRNKATPIFTHLAPCQCQGIQLVGLHLLDLRDIQVHADEVFPARCLNPMGSCRPCPKVGPPAAVCYDSTPTRRIGQRWGATRAPTWASDGGAGPFGVLPFA